MRDTATVAVLFCDVVDSTERLTRLGDEAGDEFRHRLFAELHRCVTECHGRVVKNLGDGLMVVFERSTVDAIECAACLHAAAGALDESDPVHLRVGISVGETANEEGDWFGTPVVEAARLCAAAASDQTLAPALVASVAGTRIAPHRFQPVGTIALKGLSAPLTVVSIDPIEREQSTDTSVVRKGKGRVALLLGALAACAVLVAVVFGDRGGNAPEVSGAVDPLELSDRVTRPIGYTPEFEPTECPTPVATAAPESSCGELIVPEFRGDPSGRSLKLAVAMTPADPGAPATDPVVIVDINEPPSVSSLRGTSDVYWLGLRGFSDNKDTPLTCSELRSVWIDTLTLRADDAGAIEARVEAAKSCASRLRALGVRLEGYTMVEAAYDIRDLVLALDLGRVTVAAGGFTTLAATTFARSNPGALSSLLLTNPTPPGQSALKDPTLAVATTFESVVALCEADEVCRTDYPDLESAFEERQSDLAAEPQLVSTASLSGSGPYPVLLDGRRFAAALETSMQDSNFLGLVPSAVTNASNELIAAASINEVVNYAIGDNVPAAAFLAFTCSYDALLNRTAEISDTTHAQFAGANDPTLGAICAEWGAPSAFEELSRPFATDAPVLLAAGALSVSGASGWAESMAETLPNATVVTVPTATENLIFASPKCLAELRQGFVKDPSQELDRDSCGAGPPIKFV